MARFIVRNDRTFSEGPRYGHPNRLQLLVFVAAGMDDDGALDGVGLRDVVEQASAPAIAERGEVSRLRRSDRKGNYLPN